MTRHTRPIGQSLAYIVIALTLLLFSVGGVEGVNAGLSTWAVDAITTPTVTPCIDSFEDDGVPVQAKTIRAGETQAHAFCTSRDADWLAFFAKSGEGYRVETSRLSAGVDTYLNLFAPDGRTLLLTNNDATVERGPSLLLFHPGVEGWYYVQVKNQGDAGSPGFLYSISLNLLQTATPTAPPTGTSGRTASSTPTTTPVRPATSTPTSTPAATKPPVPPSSTSTSLPHTEPAIDLLHPQKGEGGLDMFIAGPSDGMAPDAFESNNSREGAKQINVGAIYRYLNFVPQTPPSVDTDFYLFRAKRGLCYLAGTGELSSGLDTTLLLWRAVATRDKWKLQAQNDDAQPRTADLSSAVRWCAPTDSNAVIEVRNYGGAVATSPLGKSYSLRLHIDPPSPTPTRVPPTPAPVKAPSQPPASQPAPKAAQQPPVSIVPTVPKAAQPTSTNVPTSSPTPFSTASATPTLVPTSVTLTATPTLPMQSATPTPISVTVDVVAFIADPAATGPNPGDGIVALPVLLVDLRTNAVMQRASTDRNGHAQLTWIWQGPVRIALPAFRWGRTLQLADFKPDPATGEGTTLLLQARMLTYTLPGIYP